MLTTVLGMEDAMHPRKLVSLCLVVASPACPSYALEYTRVLAEESRVSFEMTRMGVAREGRFTRFRAELAFDPARPAQARAIIDIDAGSVEFGSPDEDRAARGPDWLNVAAHPRARFETTAVRPLGGNRYRAVGRLNIRGIQREVQVHFTYRPLDRRAAFEGQLRLKRLDYDIGRAVWGDTGVVSDATLVRFTLLAE